MPVYAVFMPPRSLNRCVDMMSSGREPKSQLGFILIARQSLYWELVNKLYPPCSESVQWFYLYIQSQPQITGHAIFNEAELCA